MKSHYCYKQ